jgi:hypothetical protein
MVCQSAEPRSIFPFDHDHEHEHEGGVTQTSDLVDFVREAQVCLTVCDDRV